MELRQKNELINATPTVVVLEPLGDQIDMRTAAGGVVTLARHVGPRRYFLCD